MEKKGLPIEPPEFGEEGLLFTLKDITYSPEIPAMNEPFTVGGKVELFGLPFLAPAWVIAYVTYPETFWEEIIPIWGSPRVSEFDLALGGDFEISFPNGFQREGEFGLRVEVHAGPTMPVDTFTIPPFPPLAKEETTFTVSGKAPPIEERIQEFRIISYAKNGGVPVEPPNVLELEVGDKCRVKAGFSHKGEKYSSVIHVALWEWTWYDPHNEKLFKEKAVSIPTSADWVDYSYELDIDITSAVKPSDEYGLYAKIDTIIPAAISPYYENVIKIAGVAPPAEVLLDEKSFFIPVGVAPPPGETLLDEKSFFIPVGVAPPPGEVFLDEKSFYIPVSEVPPPVVYKGSIIAKWINKAPEGNRLAMPAQVKADGNTFEVGVKYKNLSGVTIIAGCKVEVWDPDGVLRASPAVDWTGMAHNEELSKEYNISKVDKAGTWKTLIRFLTKENLELARFEGACLQATAVPRKGGITFQVGVTGTPSGWAGYDRWMVAYFDPRISTFVGDQKWHMVNEYVTFSDVQTGGYFAAWVLKTSNPSVCSPQYTSQGLWLANGKKYLFNLENLVVYEIA